MKKAKWEKIRKNPVAGLALAIVLAVLSALLGLLLPEETRSLLATSVLAPVGTAFIRLVTLIALPMIFVSVTLGIGDMGDARTLGRTNARMLIRFFGLTVLTAMAAAVLSGLVFRWLPDKGASAGLVEGAAEEAAGSAAEGVTAAGFGNKVLSAVNLLLNVVPGSLFSPFTSGNTLQIIFLAVIFGVVLLKMKQKLPSLLRGLRELNDVFMKLMNGIGRLIPFYVYIGILRLAWGNDLSGFSGIWLFLLFAVGIALLFGAFVIIKAAVRFRVSPVLLLKKVFGVFFLALTTASSAVSLKKSMETAEKELGVNGDAVRFGSPLALVFCKPMSAIYLVIISVFFAGIYGIPVSFTWLITSVAISVVLTAAIPPVSAGGVNCYVVLYGTLGIPEAALTLSLGLDPFVEFLITGFNVLSQPLELLCAAGDGKQVDLSVLRAGKGDGSGETK